jgi:hypothetical protein
MAEVVIFDIDIKGAVDKLAQIRADINAYKEQQKQLTDEVKKGNQEAARSYEANAVIIKNLSAEQRVLSRAVEGAAQVQKKNTDTLNVNNNSIQQNRDLLKQLTAQYINLKNPSTAATNQIKTLSDTLKKQEEAIGDNRRSVGNYQKALEGLGGRLPFLKNGLNGINGVINASPIGRFAQILLGLFDILKNNEKVVEFFERGLAAVNAVVSELSELILGSLTSGIKFIREGLTAAFTQPQKAITGLVNLIKDNLINRFKALGVIVNAIANRDLKGITNGLLQFGTGVENVTDKIGGLSKNLLNVATSAFDATGALQDIEDNAKVIALQIEKIDTEIASKRGKLRTKDLNERKKLAADIIKLEDQSFEITKKKVDEEVASLRTLRDANKANEEVRNRLLAAELEQQQIVTQLNNKKESLQTRINNLLQDEGKIAEKVAEQNRNYRQETLTFQEKYIQEFTTELEKELLELELSQSKRVDFLREAKLTELEIQDKFLKERQDLIDDYSEEEVEKQQSIFDAILEASFQFAVKQKAIDEQTIATQRAVQDARLQIAQDFSNGLTAILSLAGAQSAENAAFQKSLALFQIGIDTAVAIVKALRNSQSATADNFLTGGLAGIAKAAAITASILAAVAQAKQVLQAEPQPTPPQFEQGGAIDIDGKPHSQGGENVFVGNRLVANVEGGEGLFVMKKNAYQAISKYSNINKAFGGNSWGETKTHLADGGAINTSIPITDSRNLVQEQITLQNAFRNSVNNLPAPVLSIVEYQNAVSKRNKSVRISEI